MEFAYDGGGLAKAAAISLYVDGAKVGEGRIEASVPLIFSTDEATDVGSDSASPLSDDYQPGESTFTGRVRSGADRPRRGRAGRRPPDRPR